MISCFWSEPSSNNFKKFYYPKVKKIYIVLEGPQAKTDLKFGLAKKFNKRRYLDNGVTLWYKSQSFRHKGSNLIIKWVISSQPQPYLQSMPMIAAINSLAWMFWREIQISSKGKNFQRKHNTDQSYLVALSIYLFSIDLLIYGFREALDKNGPQIWNRGKV